jgi:hypothetical protein
MVCALAHKAEAAKRFEYSPGSLQLLFKQIFGVCLVSINGRHQREVLIKDDPDCWSAVTLCTGSRDLIIVNPVHSEGRLASDIMHELAHITLGHQPASVEVSKDGFLILSPYPESDSWPTVRAVRRESSEPERGRLLARAPVFFEVDGDVGNLLGLGLEAEDVVGTNTRPGVNLLEGIQVREVAALEA